jgi:hypothetical protein
MRKKANFFFIKPPATLMIYLNRLKLHKCEVMHAFHSVQSTVELMVKFLNLCVKLERKVQELRILQCTTDEALVCH